MEKEALKVPVNENIFPLETGRLVLRPFAKDDLATFTTYRNQPEVARYQSWSSYSEKEAQAFFAQQKDLVFNADNTWFQVAIQKKEDRKLVGDVALHFFDEGRQVELGMTIDTAHQRKGYAIEAVARVVELLFSELGKHRITAIVDEKNKRAHSLLEKQGFRCEAYYRENVFFKGEWGSERSYALLAKEWRRSIK